MILGEGNTSADLGDGSFWVKASGASLAGVGPGDFVRPTGRRCSTSSTTRRWTSTTRTPWASGCELRSTARRRRLRRVTGWTAAVDRDHAARAVAAAARGLGGRPHPPHRTSTRLLCSDRAGELVAGSLFPDQVVVCGAQPLLVPYAEPGLPLGRAFRDGLRAHADRHGEAPRLVYLGNHGIVALGDSAQQVRQITAMAVKAARVLGGVLALGRSAFLDPDTVRRLGTRADEKHRRDVLARSSARGAPMSGRAQLSPARRADALDEATAAIARPRRGRRWRDRCRRGARRRDAGSVGGPARGRRHRRRHVVALGQDRARRAALPRAAELLPGRRRAARAGPDDPPAGPAPGDRRAVPVPAHRTLAAPVHRRRCRSVRRHGGGRRVATTTAAAGCRTTGTCPGGARCARLPASSPRAITGALQYYDGRMDDARHTLAVARTASAYGALVLSRTPVVDVLTSERPGRRCRGRGRPDRRPARGARPRRRQRGRGLGGTGAGAGRPTRRSRCDRPRASRGVPGATRSSRRPACWPGPTTR